MIISSFQNIRVKSAVPRKDYLLIIYKSKRSWKYCDSAVYVVPQDEYDEFWGVAENRRKYGLGHHAFESMDGGEDIFLRGIDILSKHIFLVSLPAIAKNSNIAIPQNKFKLCLAKITFSYTENKPICNIESTNKKDALKEAISSYAAVHKIPKKESVVSVDVAHDPLPNTIVVLSDKDYSAYINQFPLKERKDNAIYNLITTSGNRVKIRGKVVASKNFSVVPATEKLQAIKINQPDFVLKAAIFSPSSESAYHDLILVNTTTYIQQLFNQIKQKERKKATLLKPPSQTSSLHNNVHYSPPNGANLSYDLKNESCIFLYSKKCHCQKCANLTGFDTITNCTAYVATISGENVCVTVQFCTQCGRFFMNYETFESYNRRYKGLLFECSFSNIHTTYDNPYGFSPDSILSRCGYSVRANICRADRQRVLKYILDTNKASKWEIQELLSQFIRIRKNVPSMKNAIERWKEDIAFVADYDSSKQLRIGKAAFNQGGIITR